MATINKFEDLEIWKEARAVSLQIFNLTNRAPFEKDYRFRSQMRSAAGSVMDNIAEGFERSSRLEFVNFLSIAKDSCGEVRSQLHRAYDQQVCSEQECQSLVERYERLAANVAGFIAYLHKSDIKGQKITDRN